MNTRSTLNDTHYPLQKMVTMPRGMKGAEFTREASEVTALAKHLFSLTEAGQRTRLEDLKLIAWPNQYRWEDEKIAIYTSVNDIDLIVPSEGFTLNTYTGKSVWGNAGPLEAHFEVTDKESEEEVGVHLSRNSWGMGLYGVRVEVRGFTDATLERSQAAAQGLDLKPHYIRKIVDIWRGFE